MSWASYFAFCLAMALLVLSPGPGLMAVLSRALASGMAAGLRVVTGFLLADFFYIGLAMVGMVALAEAAGPWFAWVRYAAAAYLVYLGVNMLRRRPRSFEVQAEGKRGWLKDVLLGSSVTLGNPKAIAFYSALLPTFFTLENLQLFDYLALCAATAVLSYLIYALYIRAAQGAAQRWLTGARQRVVDRTCGVALIGSGAAVALKG